jgi:hypothetical protein
MSRFEYSKSILACVALAEEHSPRRTVVFHGYFISDGLEREALDGWGSSAGRTSGSAANRRQRIWHNCLLDIWHNWDNQCDSLAQYLILSMSSSKTFWPRRS